MIRLSFIDCLNLSPKSCNSINNLTQSINNSIQVNIVNLIEENSSNKSVIRQNLYEKSFEPRLFELEHSDEEDSIQG